MNQGVQSTLLIHVEPIVLQRTIGVIVLIQGQKSVYTGNNGDNRNKRNVCKDNKESLQ